MKCRHYLTSCHARRQSFVPNCNIFSVLSIFKCNSGETSLLLLNNFNPVMSHRRAQKEKTTTNYCIRFGHSLWSAQPVASASGLEKGTGLKLTSFKFLSVLLLLTHKCVQCFFQNVRFRTGTEQHSQKFSEILPPRSTFWFLSREHTATRDFV